MRLEAVLLWIILITSCSIRYVVSAPREPTPQCDPGEENDCSRCFDVLVNQVIVNDRNRYNLQRAFFPALVANPVFVEITYYFSRNATGDGTTNYSDTSLSEKWYWTESTFYLFQPIESLQFTSLLFANYQLRHTNLTLYLQPDCYKEDDVERDERMQLFTQRLKLYSTEQSINSPIDDMYNAKAENVQTLRRFISGKTVRFGDNVYWYSIFFQILFPLLMIICAIVFVIHHLEGIKLYEIRDYFSINGVGNPPTGTPGNPPGNDDNPPTGTPGNNNSDDGTTNFEISTKNLQAIMVCIFSTTFAVYVVAMDVGAIANTLSNTKGDIFYSLINEEYAPEFAVPCLMFVGDLCILLIISLLFLILKIWAICNNCNNKCRPNLKFALKIHWYYILLGPISCIIIHSFHILVGFIHSPYHATGVLVFYAVEVFVFMFAYRSTYYLLAFCFKKKSIVCQDKLGRMTCMVISLLIVSFIVSVISVVFILFLVFIPINMAVDDAPTRLVSLNNTLLIFIAAGVTYKLFISRKVTEIVKMLAEAQDRKYEDKDDELAKKWKKMQRPDKERDIEKQLLEVVISLQKYEPPPSTQTSSSTPTTSSTQMSRSTQRRYSTPTTSSTQMSPSTQRRYST